MIPSDQFVRFYNEVFKFLSRQGQAELERYYLVISRDQEQHCLKLFKEEGLVGMKKYWDRIAVEENCDLITTLHEDRLVLEMRRCPSLSKALDNDAGAFKYYCDHCPGWIIPLLEKAGYNCEYNIIDRTLPQCCITIYRASAEHPSRVVVR